MMLIRVNTEVNTFTRVTQIQWLKDKLALLKAVLIEQVVYLAVTSHCTLSVFRNPSIPIAHPRITKKHGQEMTSKKGLRNMTRSIAEERNAFKAVRLDEGIKIHDSCDSTVML